MNYLIRFLSECFNELSEIENWYDEQRKGLGDEFDLEFYALIYSIQRTPLNYQKTKKNFHKAKLDRFPYHVYYRVENDNIIVIGIIHCVRGQVAINRLLKRND